jgi:hypothetical protein
MEHDSDIDFWCADDANPDALTEMLLTPYVVVVYGTITNESGELTLNVEKRTHFTQ